MSIRQIAWSEDHGWIAFDVFDRSPAIHAMRGVSVPTPSKFNRATAARIIELLVAGASRRQAPWLSGSVVRAPSAISRPSAALTLEPMS